MEAAAVRDDDTASGEGREAEKNQRLAMPGRGLGGVGKSETQRPLPRPLRSDSGSKMPPSLSGWGD